MWLGIAMLASKGHHPGVPSVDQEDGCPDAGEVSCVIVPHAYR